MFYIENEFNHFFSEQVKFKKKSRSFPILVLLEGIHFDILDRKVHLPYSGLSNTVPFLIHRPAL